MTIQIQQAELSSRLRRHAYDLVNGGTNASWLRRDLEAAASVLESTPVDAGAAALSRQREQEDHARSDQPQPGSITADQRVGDRDGSGLGLNLDMLDADRLREWARLIDVHGDRISEWGDWIFVSVKMRDIADRLAQEIKEVGTLRASLANHCIQCPQCHEAALLAVQPSAALSQPSRHLVEQAKQAVRDHVSDMPEGLGLTDWFAAFDQKLYNLIHAVQSAALVPQGCQTCATCEHFYDGRQNNGDPQCDDERDENLMGGRIVYATFGCIFHTPAPPLSPDPPQEK